MIKTVILDFDGVIAETMDIKTRAFLYLFRNYPKRILDKVKKFHLDNGGMSRYEKFRIIYKKFLNKPLDKKTSGRLGREFSRLCYEEVIKAPLVKGARPFLKKAYKTYNLYIVSGAPQREMRRIVKEKRLGHYFRGIYGSPGQKGKLCEAIVDKDNISPKEAVFVGDAVNDLKGAEEAGIHFVARITDGKSALAACKPQYGVKDLRGLEKILTTKLDKE